MPKFLGKTIKATIISIIVALFVTIAIIVCIKIFAGAQIEQTINLANRVAIENKQENETEFKETSLNENKKLVNYPDYGSKYATIEIPTIAVNQPVYFGDTLEILKKGVGHSSGSYFPGEGGSIIYMGHNSAEVFRRFSELQIGNEIIVKTTYGEFKYKIYDMQLINEKELDKLPVQSEKEILMVYTCYPFNNIGYATQRYVVYAEPVI
ncbi:MAG: class D sortase [Clostridia bacterium]|nr:class D sortase [Clostridia bacterium]